MMEKSQKKDRFVFMKLRFILFICLSFSVFFTVNAQSKKELEKKRERYRKEIKKAQQLLFKSKQEEQALLSDLEDINKVINVRSKLISTIREEEKELSTEIGKNQKEIFKLENTLEDLKKEYADMIVQSYKSKTKQSRLMFLLSSENFTQAYKRLQYLKQYSNYRKKQGEEIKFKTQQLTSLTDSLVARQDEKVLLIALHNKEQDSIKKEKSSQLRLVDRVKKKEKKYLAEIRQKQKEEGKISKQINRLIKEAIAASNKKTSNKKSSAFSMSPEEKLVASNFVANKGKLPWPVEKYVVVRRYGEQKHPTMPGIKIQSHGIHLATEENAKARAVFKGKVLAIQLQPGKKKMVLIKHGNYISVYKNLKSVSVSRGQSIETKQSIGTIHTDVITGKTILEFSLFADTAIQNPEPWISKGKLLTLASK